MEVQLIDHPGWTIVLAVLGVALLWLTLSRKRGL